MDLSELDVVAASDGGAELTLLHPASGKPDTAKIQVRGYDSEEVLKAGRQASKEIMAQKDTDLNDSIAARRIAMAKAAVMDVTGMSNGGKTVGVSELRKLMGLPGYSWIVDQVTDFGSQRVHFFPKPSGG